MSQTSKTNPKNESKPAKKENMLINLAFNIAIPVFLLTKFSAPEKLGPVNALLIALSFPIAYGTYDLIRSRKWNFFSIVGIANIALTGGFSLMQLEGFWFAVKEASVPALFGVVTVVSLKTRYPLVKTFLLNPAVIDTDLIHEHLQGEEQNRSFEKLLVNSTLILALSFAISSVLNFVLARIILQSPAGTPAFNEELGHMTALSYPVIMLPSMIVLFVSLIYLVHGVKKITGLELQQIIRTEGEPAPKAE